MADEAQTTAPRGRRVWRLAGVVGELLITIGVLFLLLVAYDLWWTNVEADKVIAQSREELRREWQASTPIGVPEPTAAQVFGLMYIPRLRDDVWGVPLIEGVTKEDLTQGIGHFPATALPGEVGNTSFAGHRATNGEPLRNIDKLRAGDLVHIEIASSWYTYRLTKDQIVLPTDVWVVDPVPGQPPDAVPTQQLITLVTCNPRWGSTHRWIWWGELVETRTKAQGPPADLEGTA